MIIHTIGEFNGVSVALLRLLCEKLDLTFSVGKSAETAWSIAYPNGTFGGLVGEVRAA